MTYKEKVIDLLKRMVADMKKKRDYLERYECSEDVKRLDGGLNFANNYLVALTSIKEDPVPEKIGNEPEGFVVEGKTITVNKPTVDDQPQFNLDVDESNVFTEPKESEDERVRKCLIAMVNATIWDSANLASKKACLSWLEKQKEQKPVVTHDENGDAILSDFEAALFSAFSDAWQTYLNGENVNVVEWAKEHAPELLRVAVKPAERVEINKSLIDAVMAELSKYSGENYWKSPWAIDSTGLQYPLYFANLGATWQKEQKPILEVFGFKVGDAVRLKDGDGRKHIIKSFEEVEGVHGPNFYHVEFEDNSARDGIYPGEEYPNGYYTQMEKFEEEQKPFFRQISDGVIWDSGLRLGMELEKQKKQWSEEDEKNFSSLCEFFTTWSKKHYTAYGRQEAMEKWLFNRFKYLNPQPKAEWSENIKKHLLKLAEYLRYKGCEDDAEFLESLRPQPHWKPSKEQMEVLRKYVMGEWKGLTFKEDEHLKSLLIDLENYSHDNR